MSDRYLSKARTVLRHSEPLVREILLDLGRVTLTETFEQVKEEEHQARATELDAETRLARLRDTDLADLVSDFERRHLNNE